MLSSVCGGQVVRLWCIVLQDSRFIGLACVSAGWDHVLFLDT